MFIAVSKMPEYFSTFSAIITGHDANRVQDWLKDRTNTPGQLEITDCPTLRFNSHEIMTASHSQYIKTDIMLIRTVSDPLNRGHNPAGQHIAPHVKSHHFMIVKNVSYLLESYGPNGRPALLPDIHSPRPTDTNRVLTTNVIRMPSPVVHLGPVPAVNPFNPGPPTSTSHRLAASLGSQPAVPTNINIHLDSGPGPSRLRRTRDSSSRSTSNQRNLTRFVYPNTPTTRGSPTNRRSDDPVDLVNEDEDEDFQEAPRQRGNRKGGK